MGGEEQATTSVDDVVVSDGVAVNMNVQVNGFLAEAVKGQTPFADSAGSLGDGFFAFRSGSLAGSSGDSFRTYKRRKRAQAEDMKLPGNVASQIEEKPTKELPDILANKDSSQHATVAGTSSHIGMNASYDCSVKQRRNIVLQQICESLDDEAGLVKCIRDALVLHSEKGCTSAVKESIHSCEDGTICTSLPGPRHSQFQNEARCIENVTSNGSVNDKNCRTVTELCQQTFLDVIMSEKFSILCNILIENFQEMRVDKLFDIACINSRMKEGTYEKSPRLFYSDIQQFWVKLQKIGSDIAALANHLSEKSRAAYRKQVGSSLHGSSLDGVVEFVSKGSDMPSKVEQTEGCGTCKSVTCNHCNGKTDGGDCLVCDSCEAVYHVSCIEPAVKEIPPKSWYCASCTKKGILSPHDDCVICKKIYASRSFSTMDVIDPLNNAETSAELEESSNGLMEGDLQLSKEGKGMPRCNICKSDVQIGEKLKVCGHSFCPHKFYHARCLTSKQLKSYGPCWYCPSCMCRVCFIDRDDEKIVMCDACDHAYHIYCLKPPRTMIPRGKWFCTNCEEDIRRIRKAKKKYEKSLRKQPELGKTSHDGRIGGKRKKQEPFDKSGAEMLLNAARALNFEENLAAMGRNS